MLPRHAAADLLVRHFPWAGKGINDSLYGKPFCKERKMHAMFLLVFGTLLMASPVMAEKLVNLSTKYCLDTDGRAVNGGSVRMWRCETHPNQEWSVTRVGSRKVSNFFQLINLSSKFCLDTDGSKMNGAQVRMWGCANHPNQLWEIRNVPTPTGGLRFRNKASGLCLDTDGRQGNGARVRMWQCANHPNQSWTRQVRID